jgi:hypothetical protein
MRYVEVGELDGGAAVRMLSSYGLIENRVRF